MRALMILTLICSLLPLSIARAQLEKTMSIKLDPPLVQLNKRISVELKSPALDVSTALIVWKLDGVVLGQGIGATETSITLTKRSPSMLEVTVVERDGTESKLTQTIQASDVDIVWEGLSYTPPFYEGRALAAAGGRVVATAIPHTTLGSADTLIYTWYQDGKALGKQSGFGKSSVQIQMPAFGDDSLVSVEVKNLNNEYVGGNGVRIKPAPVTLRLYQQKTLVGLWTNTVVALIKSLDGATSLRAVPYNIDGTTVSRVQFAWKSDTGEITPEPQGRASYTPRAQAGIVSVDVSHSSKLLQEATLKTRIGTFVESTLFGL